MLDESNTEPEGRTQEEDEEWEDEELLEEVLSPEQEQDVSSGDVWRHRTPAYISSRDLHQVVKRTDCHSHSSFGLLCLSVIPLIAVLLVQRY